MMDQHESSTPLGETLDFRKAPYLQLAQRSNNFLGTFLLTLAAYQKGLQISFLYDAEHVRGEDREGGNVQVGRSFALSHGDRVFRFSSTAGPFTTPYSRRLTLHKHTQKQVYIDNGLPVPVGMLSNKRQVGTDLAQIGRESGASRFVIKPFDGSLARDTYVDKTADEIIEISGDFPDEQFMLEEFVTGPEYRFTVVNDKCVGVFERRPPFVVGDGTQTVEELIAAKNRLRAVNPFLSAKPIKPEELLADPAERAAVLARVPAAEETVYLSDLQRVGVGGEPWDVTDIMPEHFKQIAVEVCRCIKARNSGIDIIIGSLDDPRSARVLEANIRHHIEGHSFCENKPVWDNAVAEAIVEMYFPETVGIEMHGKAVFDHARVRRALQSQAFAALHMPKVADDWVSWHFLLGRTSAHKAIRDSILPEIGQRALYSCEVSIDSETTCLTLMGPAEDFEKFLLKTGLVRSLALADELEALQGAASSDR